VSCHQCYVKYWVFYRSFTIYWLIWFSSVCPLNYIIIVIIAYKQVHYRKKNLIYLPMAMIIWDSGYDEILAELWGHRGRRKKNLRKKFSKLIRTCRFQICNLFCFWILGRPQKNSPKLLQKNLGKVFQGLIDIEEQNQLYTWNQHEKFYQLSYLKNID